MPVIKNSLSEVEKNPKNRKIFFFNLIRRKFLNKVPLFKKDSFFLFSATQGDWVYNFSTYPYLDRKFFSFFLCGGLQRHHLFNSRNYETTNIQRIN